MCLFSIVFVSPDRVLPSFSQVLEYSDDQFAMLGWIQLPIFSHIGALTFVNRTIRSEIPITLEPLDPSKLSYPADLKSELDAETDTPYAVVQVCSF